jgi:DNA repair photolyase
MAATYKEYQCKSMLRVHKFVDNWFWESASVSPYKACEYGCNYCDGRSKRYYASSDFDNLIHVKINAEKILRKELDKMFPKQKTLTDIGLKDVPKKGKSHLVVAVSSGISDAYQQAEKKYKLTRKILKLFLEYNVPTYVMTKSDLVLRDLDLLRKLNDNVWCNVSFSLSTCDKKIAGIFEPKASSPKKRLEAMKKISEAGILTGVTYRPIIPYLSDSKRQLEDSIKKSKAHGAKYILAASMTMRDLQMERFYKTIDKHYPELEKKYKLLYKRGYQPDGKYLRNLYQNLNSICLKYDIQRYIPRYIPDIELKKNLETSTALHLVSYFLMIKGERYKSEKYRRVAQTIENMDDDIKVIFKEGRLKEIKGIDKESKEVIEEFLKTGSSIYLEKLKGKKI